MTTKVTVEEVYVAVQMMINEATEGKVCAMYNGDAWMIAKGDLFAVVYSREAFNGVEVPMQNMRTKARVDVFVSDDAIELRTENGGTIATYKNIAVALMAAFKEIQK
jgi:hypothetical protein